MGAFEEAEGCRHGERTRAVFPLHPPASTPKQLLIKKKSVRTCLSVAPFYVWLHVPFRIEAVIKILTFGFKLGAVQQALTLRVFFSLVFRACCESRTRWPFCS